MIRLPSDFYNTIPLPEEGRKQLTDALSNKPAISVRVNPDKLNIPLDLEKVVWCRNGYYLKQRPVFTFDPLFHSGAYYVQEASSMIIGEIVSKICKEHKVEIAIDLCAAPGGKTTHLLSELPSNAVLISNEVVASRIGALVENIVKWGNNNSIITSNDPSHFTNLENLADLILVDAPCSGEGMFRKETAAITEWSLKNVEHCSIRQKSILSDIIPVLKPGGFLIYSTCTYNEKENEENVNYILENFNLELYDTGFVAPEFYNASTKTFRFYPHKIKGEGLFVAVFRKKETEYVPFKIKTENSVPRMNNFSEYLKNNGPEFTFFPINDSIRFIRSEHFNLMETLRKKLKIIHAGPKLGILKGKEIVPDHELVLSKEFNKSYFPSFELSYADAIKYLSKEVPQVNAVEKGWGYFTFKNLPLGLFKSVPGRINNYFPKELKIRMKYNDSQQFTITEL